ncbi:hypothetical protein IV102_19380 [bacterium]|nr:hypothetical protein [bacterium]
MPSDDQRSMEDVPKTGRGRLPSEVRAQIQELHAQGVSVETIAERTLRSVATVRKIVNEDSSIDSTETPNNQDQDLDEVIDFLSSLPEEAIEEILQLARLQRERRQLRSSLEIRLRDLKKPG